MEQNIAAPLPIAAIAARLGMSTRQMERLFRTALGQRPTALYRTVRLRYARWLLDNTDQSAGRGPGLAPRRRHARGRQRRRGTRLRVKRRG